MREMKACKLQQFQVDKLDQSIVNKQESFENTLTKITQSNWKMPNRAIKEKLKFS